MRNSFTVVPVRAFQDNYIWLLHDGNQAVAVDPGDAAPVLQVLQRYGLQLAAILLTHHHGDHIGGVSTLLQNHAVPVYGPVMSTDFAYSVAVAGNTIRPPATHMSFSVLETPGHTAQHLCYYAGNHLFCGDTLFGCGCGRIFDGSMETLFTSLQKIAALPDETLIYPAHEYTLNNLRFALHLEPNQPNLLARWQAESIKIQRGEPTLPTTLQLEKATNPFLRCFEPTLQSTAAKVTGATTMTAFETFRALRNLRNQF